MDRGVVLALDEIAERVSHSRRLEQPRRQLVEQRLERVVVVPVHDNDVDVGVLQLPCGTDPGKAAAENEDPRSLDAGDVRHDASPDPEAASEPSSTARRTAMARTNTDPVPTLPE